MIVNLAWSSLFWNCFIEWFYFDFWLSGFERNFPSMGDLNDGIICSQRIPGFFHGMALAVAIHSVGFAAVIPEFRGMNGLSYPSEREIRALGQLGGALNPTPVTAKTNLNEDNRAFGLAMNLWNTHAYAEARGSLSDYLIKFPGGRWAGEAILHLGCEARFNGRLSESEALFSQLVRQYQDSEEADAQMVVEKAVSRLAEQKLLQNQREDALRLFPRLQRKVKIGGIEPMHRTGSSVCLVNVDKGPRSRRVEDKPYRIF